MVRGLAAGIVGMPALSLAADEIRYGGVTLAYTYHKWENLAGYKTGRLMEIDGTE